LNKIFIKEIFVAKKQYSSYPDMVIDTNKTYQATIKTDKGDIQLDLFAKDTPKTVNNFVFLARDKFYDGLTFHRVINNFMTQGGDPDGDGRGGPGYRFEDETRGNPRQKHETGSLSMANAGPNTNGSQLVICQGPQPHLAGKHTDFGKVTRGQEVDNSLKNGDVMNEVVITES
jgi:peptidyl-prolyl cis-trans isomerase B (cyclophilin B)